VGLLKQVKGVGTLIALTYLLTGRRASFSQEPRCELLFGIAARRQELGREPQLQRCTFVFENFAWLRLALQKEAVTKQSSNLETSRHVLAST